MRRYGVVSRAGMVASDSSGQLRAHVSLWASIERFVLSLKWVRSSSLVMIGKTHLQALSITM